MIDKNKRYKEVKNRYLAESLAFLGFRYYKMGYGKKTIYSFEDTESLNKAYGDMLDLQFVYRK